MRKKKKKSTNIFEFHENIKSSIKKTQKYTSLSFILAFLVTCTFYFYAHQNQKFEIQLSIYVNKHAYDHYNLNSTFYYGEIRNIIKNNMLLDKSIIKKEHKLSFGNVIINDQNLHTAIFENYVYGINLDKNALEKFFEKILDLTNEEYKKGLVTKLESLKKHNKTYDNLMNNEMKKYDNWTKNMNIAFDYTLNSPIEHVIKNRNAEKAIDLIVNDKYHFSYSYYVISKKSNLLILPIIVFIFSFLVTIIVIGLYFAGKRLLINDQN